MPIDPSIALNVKPVQLTNPLEQYMQVQQIQQAQNQSRLQDLMYGEKQRDLAADKVQADALANAQDVSAALAKAGYGARAVAYQRAKVDADAKQADIGKTKAEAQAKQIESLTKANGLIGSAAGAIMQNPTYDNAVNVVNGLRQQFGPDLSKQFGLDTLEIPQDPAQLKDWANNHYLASVDTAKQLEDARIKSEGLANRGSQEKIAAGHDATSRANTAATVAATIRGQDLVDARARELNQQGQYDADRGVLVNKRTGVASQVVDTSGKPLQGGKPMTEFQGKSAAFADRAQEADTILNGLAGKYRPAAINSKQTVQDWPIVGGAAGAVTNKFALSEADQRAEQAQRNFVNAILRQESGAVISPSEFENAKQQYFPQPGDTPALIAQKAANRKTAIAGLSRSAGPSYAPAAAPNSAPAPTPTANSKGWTLHVDANGNKAYVSPDGKSYEEVK
jgi:hypothetical protein